MNFFKMHCTAAMLLGAVSSRRTGTDGCGATPDVARASDSTARAGRLYFRWEDGIAQDDMIGGNSTLDHAADGNTLQDYAAQDIAAQTNAFQPRDAVSNGLQSDPNRRGPPLLRIKQIASTPSDDGTAVISVQFVSLISPNDQKDFAVKMHDHSAQADYTCRDLTFKDYTAFCRVSASWLRSGSIYSFDVSNKRGVARYDVHFKYVRGKLVDAYLDLDELNRWLFPLRIVGMYVLCSLLLLCVYEYGKNRSKRYQERMAEVDSMIREIQEQVGEEEQR